MGLSDTVLVLDGKGLPCPGGHFSRDFQTKDLEHPSMCTYLLHGGTLSPLSDEACSLYWRANPELAEGIHGLRGKLDVRSEGHCRKRSAGPFRGDAQSR